MHPTMKARVENKINCANFTCRSQDATRVPLFLEIDPALYTSVDRYSVPSYITPRFVIAYAVTSGADTVIDGHLVITLTIYFVVTFFL